MNVESVFREYSEYYRRKWYPAQHQDPLGPFADCLSQETVAALEKDQGLQSAALITIILDLILAAKHPDLLASAEHAYGTKLNEAAAPAQVMYFLRALPDAERAELWEALKRWCANYRTPLWEWADATLAHERKHEQIRARVQARFGISEESECSRIEAQLRGTRDLFDFELRRTVNPRTLADCLGAFRMREADSLIDWNDFPALARSYRDLCGSPPLPVLRASEDPSAQLCLPADPPSRVHLRYGTSAGPLDSLRFLYELGRGGFYCGMNPELAAHVRFCGDARLPHFWGFLAAAIPAQPQGFNRLVRIGAHELVRRLQLAAQFWARYDGALSLYRLRLLKADMKEAQDIYVDCWEAAFRLEPPHFLHLYDLQRSAEALTRFSAYRAASTAVERLKSLFGTDWFASSACARRLADYRYEAFGIGMHQVLVDLQAPDNDNFLVLEGV